MEENTESWNNLTTLDTLNVTTESPDQDLPPLQVFNSWYGECHGYVAACVCVFGIISNVVNIIVLTRKNMVSPTNCLLSALAIADILTMAVYLPYAIYLYIIKQPDPYCHHSKAWVIYILFNNIFVVTAHQMAMWLTVSLAIFRYIVVCFHSRGPHLCSLRRAKLTIIIVSVASVLISVPNYLNYKVTNLEDDPNFNHTGYWFALSHINEKTDAKLSKASFWLYAVCFRIAPCILLVVLSSLLIIAMHTANQRRLRLLSQSRRAEDEHGAEHNRTTAMLVAVVLFFVLTELPIGILALLSAIIEEFFDNYYVPLGDVMDILVLVNSAVNFILYCIMSRQFRRTFRELFHVSCINKILGKKSSSNGTHYCTIKTEVTQL